MALTFTWSNHFKYSCIRGYPLLSGDTCIAILMHEKFVFNKDEHAAIANFNASTGSIGLVFTAVDQKITRSTGSFIADGFCVGSVIAGTTALNPGPFSVTVVTALYMEVDEALVDETTTGTITDCSEIPSGNGYTQRTLVLTSPVMTEDDSDDRAEFTCDDLQWVATGGNIGPTVGCLVYNSSIADSPVMGFFDFGGAHTFIPPWTIDIKDIELRLS